MAASSLPTTWESREVRLNPFASNCLGVLTADSYYVTLQLYRVNYWLVLATAAGLTLFFMAPKLCRNVFFHYATGVGAGILLSLVVVTYFVQRRVRAGWFGWILGFYSVSVYFLTSLWSNLRMYLEENQALVVGYLVLTGGISFAVCYRMGPVENPRSLDLIQWSLQLVGLLLVYLSSHHQAASLAVAAAAVTWVSVPDPAKAAARTWYRKRFFRPTVRLLSEGEYLDQSRLETEKALNELRQYCASPKCDAWKVASRLQSPTRFAEFVQGSPHISQGEVMEYSRSESFGGFDETDDEDEPAGSGAGQPHLLTDDEDGSEDAAANGNGR